MKEDTLKTAAERVRCHGLACVQVMSFLCEDVTMPPAPVLTQTENKPAVKKATTVAPQQVCKPS